MNQMTPTQPTPLAPEARLTVTLAAAAWNVVMAQLAEGPYRIVAPIFEDLRSQLALGAEQIQRNPRVPREMATHATED